LIKKEALFIDLEICMVRPPNIKGGILYPAYNFLPQGGFLFKASPLVVGVLTFPAHRPDTAARRAFFSCTTRDFSKKDLTGMCQYDIEYQYR
jgi:hypothetical protein